MAARLKDKVTARRPWGLVVVAEGAKFIDGPQARGAAIALSKLRCRHWRRVKRVSTSFSDRVRLPRPWRIELQLLIAEETFPLVLGPWVRGGAPTAVDRQLGLGYGAGAVRALQSRQERGDGGLCSAGHQVRSADGSHQQSQNRARRQRVHADRPVTRYLSGEGTMKSQPNNSSAPTGIVLNIQRYCSHDGPGIRTTVFLKGCSLRCKWCGNPESIALKPELAYDPKLCVGKKECGACLKPPFPEGAFYVVGGPTTRSHRVNWDLANGLRRDHVALCPTQGALHVRQTDDRGRGAGRSGEGRLVLPVDPAAASR